MERFLPTEPLGPFVKTFMIIDSEQGMLNRILPDTSLVLAFQYRGQVRYTDGSDKTTLPTSVITGLRHSIRLIEYTRQTATLLVIFREAGAMAFFREPLHELFGLSVALNNFVPGWIVGKVEEQLAEAKTNRQRITLVEQFLLSRLQATPGDKLVERAIQQIRSSKGTVRINELLRELPISQDPFEKRFRRAVGTSPKQFAEIVRLRTLIQQHTPTQSLTEMAHGAGYFDQAHFSKDFKAFTGQTPQRFFNAGPYW